MKLYSAIFLACAATCATVPLRADEKDERTARSLFAEGNRLAVEGDYAAALQRYQSAYELFPNAKILLNIGTVLRELRRSADAARAYEQYLSHPGADPARKSEVSALLTELESSTAKVNIDSAPEMRVLVDGRMIEDQERRSSTRVDPGAHLITGEQEGIQVISKSITVVAGDEVTVSLRLDSAAPLTEPSPPATAPIALPKPPTRPVAPPHTGIHEATSKRITQDSKPLSHHNQFGAFLRADIDGQGRGLATVLGLSYGLGAYADIGAAAILARDKGFEPSATFYLTHDQVKPLISLGAPTFIKNGLWPGIRGSLGLMWDPSTHFGLFAHIGASAFPAAPEGYSRLIFVPALGIQSRI